MLSLTLRTSATRRTLSAESFASFCATARLFPEPREPISRTIRFCVSGSSQNKGQYALFTFNLLHNQMHAYVYRGARLRKYA